MTQNHIDILKRLNAMRSREETTSYLNYFNRDTACNGVNEACREAMVTWITQVQETLSFSPETVWIAMSFFDRYLSSGKGTSQEALESKRKFQLASITALYLAIKIYEPKILDIDMLVQLCRGGYEKSDFIKMERDILFALNWRVSVHTPMDFARCLLELLPIERLSSRASDALLEVCQENVNFALADVSFLSYTPSAVGISCLLGALSNCHDLSLLEKQTHWATLSELCQFDTSPKEVIAAQNRLPSHTSPHSPSSVSKLVISPKSSARVSTYKEGSSLSSSLTCVIQAAQHVIQAAQQA